MRKKKPVKKRKDVSGLKFQFKVFISPKNHPEFFWFKVYEDEWALNRARKPKDGGCLAFFQPTTIETVLTVIPGKGEFRNANNELGSINFSFERLRIGLIAHEIAHAVLFWCSRHGIDPIQYTESKDKDVHFERGDDQEIFAEVTGSLMAQAICSILEIDKTFFPCASAESKYF